MNKRDYTIVVINLQPSLIKTEFFYKNKEEQMAIIVSADYFGGVVANIRQKGDVTTEQLTHLFGCSARQLHRYEDGRDLIPRDIIKRIVKYAVKMDTALEQK